MAICVDAEKWICILHCQTMSMMQLLIILYDLTIILSEVLVFSNYLCIYGIQENNKGENDMPRGVKGSGKGTAAKKEVQKVVAEKTRKPYPSIDERIALADQAIERLTKLNASRAELIAQTEAKLAERKAALAKSQEALEKEEAKKAEKEKYDALVAALAESGKTVDELRDALRK